MATLDDVLLGSQASKGAQEEVESEGYGTPYLESNDEDSVDELGSDGELRQKKEHYRRFKSSDDVPKFELGMKFSGKKEFKEAIIRYCLHERKVVNFIKDEPTRVKAKCDWAHCPWVCLCFRNSRTTSWQVATFKDEHTLWSCVCVLYGKHYGLVFYMPKRMAPCYYVHWLCFSET